MNGISLKPQLNLQNPQKDLLSKGVTASAGKPTDVMGSSAKKDAKASFDSVLKEKQNPSQSDGSLKSDKNLSRDLNKNTKIDSRDANTKVTTAETEKQEKSSQIAEPTTAQPVQNANEQASEAATREKVMTTFLNRMQSELGVEPEQFVEAFSQLEITDLALPPEETIQKVIANLDLNEAQEHVAEGLYSEMLAMSAAANMSQYLKENAQTAQLEVLTPEQASVKQTQKNIDQMNSQFFVNNQQQPKEMTQTKKAQGYQAYAPKEIGAGLASQMPAVMNSSDAGAVANPNMAPVSQMSAAQSSGIDLSGLDFEDTTLDPETEDAIAQLQNQMSEMSVQAPAEQALAPEINLDGYVAKEMSVKMETAPAFAGAAAPEVKALGKADSTEFGFSSDSDDSQDSQLDQTDPSAFSVDGPKNIKPGQSQFAIQTPKATTAEIQGNIQEIISQAQFLAKKGGGEMKVQMSPEGMGDLKLKVAIVDGQVSVEMVTANSEAKKLIEKGMSELKASLASQKLNVEHIRIDSPSETSNQMNNQTGQDAANRQYQQKFLQDFRDNNSGFRREFFDVGTASVPGSQLRDRASNSVYDPAASKKSSRRLDVVA